MRTMNVLLLLLVLSLGLTAANGQTVSGEPQVSFPSAQYIPSHDYDTKNIMLNLRFDWDQEQALGAETISLSPLVVNLRHIELDAANMTINSVKLRSGEALKFHNDS